MRASSASSNRLASPNKKKSQSNAESLSEDEEQSPTSSQNGSSIATSKRTRMRRSTSKPKTKSKAKRAKNGEANQRSRISTHTAHMVHEVDRDQIGNIAYHEHNELIIRKKDKYRVFYNNITKDAHMKAISGTMALEIRNMMNSYKLLIPRLSFARVCKEEMQSLGFNGRVTSLALQAIQESAEDMLVQMFREINAISASSRRMTILPRDLNTLKDLLRNRGITL